MELLINTVYSAAKLPQEASSAVIIQSPMNKRYQKIKKIVYSAMTIGFVLQQQITALAWIQYMHTVAHVPIFSMELQEFSQYNFMPKKLS